MVRNILAAVVALLVGWIVTSAIQMLNFLISGLPWPDMNDASSFQRMIDSMTTLHFIVLLLGYALGSFAAGLTIGWIAKSKGNIIPLIIGGFLTLMWVLNNVSYTHPMWVLILGLFMFIPFMILGKNFTAGSDTVSAEAGLADDAVAAGGGLSEDGPEEASTQEED
ncbi:MAG: hypothetical protein DWQ47_11260 [Acidobacteria bacterium]|nr:MAG: hypothetical protein DWQ32_13675 [Acidobacteriota bacterium]REJ98155.1 MAG: hypothetical protein DWQ38_16475 [Acidobacteriota bacterium]REK16898.1 MAG: hypothetical protein DWQ43_01520 [Acidobacteriota bacterium]REK42809.1 MAG: hypothetical protein DWQ47_11260 [Acidobacteriota bacterium]